MKKCYALVMMSVGLSTGIVEYTVALQDTATLSTITINKTKNNKKMYCAFVATPGTTIKQILSSFELMPGEKNNVELIRDIDKFKKNHWLTYLLVSYTPFIQTMSDGKMSLNQFKKIGAHARVPGVICSNTARFTVKDKQKTLQIFVDTSNVICTPSERKNK